MQAKNDTQYSLLQIKSGIYGLYPYYNFLTKDKEKFKINNKVIGFKSRGQNLELFKKRITQIASILGCTRIVAVPPHDLSKNSVQKIFHDDGIVRIVPGKKRRFTDQKYNPSDFIIKDTGEKTLIVDDICSTGETLEFFGTRFSSPVLFAIGINSNLGPIVVKLIDNDSIKDKKVKKKTPPPPVKNADDIKDRPAFIAALKNGMGLTQACKLIHMSAREMSTIIIRNHRFAAECEEALKFSAKALLVMSNEFLQKKQFGKWLNQNEYIQNFHVNLVLWESYRKRKDVTEMDIIIGYKIYRDLGELSTACGFKESDMIEYISRNSRLSIYFTDIGVLK